MNRLRFAAARLLLLVFCSMGAYAQPSGFQVSTVWSGFATPVAVRFAPDGRVFVLEKWGRIKAFDNLSDTTETIVADFGNQIYSFHDHGILGLAVDPQFPTRPYLYVLYALRGSPGGRISRITVNPATNQMTAGSELILAQDYATVYPSHGAGDLRFGPEGALYATFGDAASYEFTDWGQTEPVNPDSDPAGPIDINDPPLEGGALRTQDLRSTGDPLGLNGTLIRINPDTGAAWPSNPLIGGSTADDRILAYGLRNPFRFTIHPTNNAVYICDVGWTLYEEINKVPFPFPNPTPNFGWPAYEGPNAQPSYQAANLPLLQSLYSAGTATAPYYSYPHPGGASVTGAAVYLNGNYPAKYYRAMFFGDYSIGWIKVMLQGSDGAPDPNNIETFIATGAAPVDIQVGPNGDIFYVDLNANRVRRISYLSGNNPPNAVIQASTTSGNAPLDVTFNGSSSSDPDAGDTLTYSWDLNGDNVFGDATTANTQYTYTASGNYSVKLRVTDSQSASDTKGVTISVNNLPPVPEILTPSIDTEWKAGDTISFSGRATDPESGLLAASQLSWEVVLLHCADTDFIDCHEHPVLQTSGVDSGQFLAVDHEYPCAIRITLTATEPGPNGLSVSTTRDIFPQTTTLTLESNPPGLFVGVYAETAASPLVREVVVNGQSTINTFSPQAIGVQAYDFSSWSDGGAQSHNVQFSAAPMTITANFVPQSGGSNNPPVMGPLWEQSVTAGNGIGFYISATDPDGPAPTLSATNLPAGAQFLQQPDRRVYFEWFTTPADAGDHVITVTATDTGVPPLSTSGNLIIHVLSANKPPSMDAVWNTTVNAGAFINLRIGAWDTDGDVPDLFAQNLPPGASYSEDGWGTGFLTWQTTTADVGVYTGIRVYAVDHGVPPLTSQRIFQINVNGSPNAPVITAIPSSTALAGNTLTLNVTSSDPNGTIPVLTAQNLPAGATFTPTGGGNGVFNWPTTASNVGNHSNITILATDSATPSLTYKAMFNVNVMSNGSAPVLDPIGAKAALEDTQLQFTVTANDPDGPPPALSVIDLPLGASFINNGNGTGTFTWTPAVGDHEDSPYAVTFVATDATTSDSETIQITVTSPNSPPHLETIGPKSGTEGQLLAFSMHAHDHDGQIPTISATGVPNGATFTDLGGGDGSFSWTPPVGASANSPYSVTFTAFDGSLTHSETVSITINPAANSAPVVAAFGPFTIAEGQVWSANVSANDPNGTIPTLSAPTLPSGASFTNNGDGTGTISWTPGFDASATSPHAITISATDGQLSDSKSSTITVTDVNRAPVMTAVGNKTTAENQLLTFTVTASDPDGTVPALSATGVPSGATFVNNGNGTGTFTWTPDFNAAGASPYNVTFTASDGTLTDSKPSQITVTNVNRAPVMTAVGNKTTAENQLLTFTVTASDPDGTVPTLSATGLPSGATFVNNGNGTGIFTWTPDFNAAGASPYNVNFVASDGTLTDSKPSQITVTNVNRAPVMTAVGNKTTAENQLLTFTVTASDPDGTVPTLSATGVPSGASFVNNGNGTGTFTWTPDFNAAGASPYNVNFVASDGTLTDSKPSQITVTNVNRAPVVAAVGNKTAVVGQLLQFTVTASDPDGTVPTLSAQNVPGGANFVNNGNGTGTFTWTPNNVGSSPYTVTFRATDGALTDSKQSVITVTTSSNQAPVFQTIWARQVTAGSGIGFYITATDPDGGSVAYSSPNLPAGAQLIQFAGNPSIYFEWFPTAAQVGSYQITINATDAGSPPLTGSAVLFIEVMAGNKPPSMDTVSNQTVTAGALINLRIGAWDTDGDIPTLTAANLPPGATYTSDSFGTGFFVWQTNASHVGVYQNITITATDHGNPVMSSQRVFRVTVNAP
ncbi:MAG: tandem-95 repeat protein [Candidatus Hydrogenedentes bacterium]|nr:tandem-95 repeat protein [Candidatus Hydrogenedentota bacterium]